MSASNRSPPTSTARLARIVVAMALAASTAIATQANAQAPIESFDSTTWRRLQNDLPRPAVVVFSTSYCATCPEVFDGLAQAIRARGLQAPLVAVVMDGAQQPSFKAAAHFHHADRLFVFQGNEMALRYSVDPGWRGVTPYVALLGREGPPVFVAGRPSESMLEKWSAR